MRNRDLEDVSAFLQNKEFVSVPICCKMVHENMILVGPFSKSEMGFMALDLKHLGLV